MSYLGNSTLANVQTAYYALAGDVPVGPPGPAGPAGPPGAAGLSILSDVIPPAAGVGVTGDLYVDLTTTQLYKKTEAGWVPEFGMQGEPGAPGAAATITVGGTSTGNAGSEATVINTGTATNAVLQFTIPRGQTGPPGPPTNAATWSKYPAAQDLDMSANNINNAGQVRSLGVVTASVDTATVNAGELAAATGDLTISTGAGNVVFDVSGGDVEVLQGDLNLYGHDIKRLGSLHTSGLANDIVFGSYVPPSAPLELFQVLANEITMTHLNPVTELSIKAQTDARIEATNGDLNLIGKDVNIGATGTSVMNLTALTGGVQIAAGLGINNSAGGAYGIQAGGLVSITTLGSIQIGSGNVLGASTSIEKMDINDNIVTKVSGAADLQYQNTALIQNSGTAANTLTIESVDAEAAVRAKGLTLETTGVVSSGDIQVKTPAGIAINVAASTGLTSFNLEVPQCTLAPTSAADLANKSYVDTKLPGDADISLTHNLVAAAASGASASPFIYVPGTAGPPTGTPTVIAGAVPLYVDTTGFGKLYGYFNGAWLQL